MRRFSQLVLAIAGLLTCSFAEVLHAQGPPITVETPIMLGLEGSGIRTIGRFTSGQAANGYVHVLAVPYNITNKFQVGGVLPYVVRIPSDTENAHGIGDATVFAKYQLYKRDKIAQTFRLVALVRQSFPTGNSSSNPPVGSGVYQTYIGLIAGRITTRAGFYGDLGYKISSGGQPESLVYNMSAGFPLLPHRYPQRQLSAYAEINGISTFSTESHSIMISPGIQYIPGRRLLIESSVQIPVLQEQVGNKINYTVLLGVRFLLN